MTDQDLGATASQSLAVFDLKHALEVASRVDGEDAKIVALLHDAIEDGGITPEDIEALELPLESVQAIFLLTRDGQSYDDYIAEIRDSGNDLAVYVKLADLQANLDRMDDEHASLSGRYRKARRLLTQDAATAAATQKGSPEDGS